MPTMKGRRLVKWMGWNMKASGAKKKAPISLAIRRIRQVALLLRVRPGVFIAVEVGTPAQARSLANMLKRAKSPLRLAAEGGAWRYIFYDPAVASRIASGLYQLPTKWQGDNKPLVWMVANTGVPGYRRKSLYLGGHLENIGPTAIKVKQAKDIIAFARDKMKLHDIESWKDVYLYVDTNDPTGNVQEYLEAVGLESVTRSSRKNVNTSYRSANGWKRRTRASIGRSIDWWGAGDDRPHGTVTQHDCHRMSDHDARSMDARYA